MRLKQQKFCEEYLRDFNGTQAAIRAGYRKTRAGETACDLLAKKEIKDHINQLLEKASLSAGETSKLLSDMARASLNDYFVIKQVEHTPRIRVSLKVLIDQLREEIRFEDEVAERSGYSSDELEVHQAEQQRRKRKIIRYELELQNNPKATRIVNGETVFVDTVELDMVKLTADKERGRIKSITPGQHGAKVELYAADAALVNVARIHGLFEKDNNQSAPIIPAVSRVEIVPAKPVDEE